MKQLKNFGFTLVEVMIVVVIIGVLAGIAIPNYMRSVEIAKCSQGMAVLKNMRTASLDYFRENDTFAGMDMAALEGQVGITFANTNDWTFAVSAVGASTFTLTASRTGGPHGAGSTITVDEIEAWGGTYPHTDPGNF